MSFVGGGSDLHAFYSEDIGAVLSTSISKYIYIAINKKFDGRIRLSYTRTEDVDFSGEISHPLVRNALDLLGIDRGIEIASMADIPSKGSGLGSSSSFTVGLLNALYAYQNRFASKDLLAKQACEIEIDRCGEPIGKQDQYAAAFGGLNLIRFHPDESVFIDPIICKPHILRQLEESTLVLFTGRMRSASSVLAEQSRVLQERGHKILMRRMVQLAFELKSELEAGSLDNFGEALNENWILKRQLSQGVSDPQIDDWYLTGIKNGALGGKLLGAGSGGFMMFYAPPDSHAQIISALKSLNPVRFSFERAGTQVVFYQPEE